ncbi:MAG: Asp-tRNA(Asn)/Glu-tRNA(Gln) amidotransferase subunit GatB [Patescibacteria group bacterium]
MYQPVIGLEIHIQLKTKSKMFCGCKTHDISVKPNENVCPVCMGHPGVLPVPNEQAVRFGVLIGHALNCQITVHSKFDRKNYFYPDLPKAYQISQFDLPIAKNGFLEITDPQNKENPYIKIGITRAHLEEDAAKNIHDASGNTYIDFNRGGTPLVEIVTEPDFTCAHHTKIFLHELRLIARYLNISSADMEKGQLRCDANISLRQIDDNGEIIGATFNPKTEIKNLNSFRHVERALEYEIKRQTKLWQAGTPPMEQSTRGWNESKQQTELQRIKEDSDDYRYFPEPDIPPMDLTQMIEQVQAELPELPAARRARFVDEYEMRTEDAKQICDDPALADFVEAVFSELEAWLQSVDDPEAHDKKKMAKLVSSWTITKLGGLLAERSSDVRIMKVTPENFAELITLIATGKLSQSSALQVLNEMLEAGEDPSHIMEDKKLGRMEDEGEIADVVDRVLEMNPNEVERYKAGEKQLMKFFVGMIMKETEGTADPGIAQNMLKVKLEK